jgi:hypothetical protein
MRCQKCGINYPVLDTMEAPKVEASEGEVPVARKRGRPTKKIGDGCVLPNGHDGDHVPPSVEDVGVRLEKTSGGGTTLMAAQVPEYMVDIECGDSEPRPDTGDATETVQCEPAVGQREGQATPPTTNFRMDVGGLPMPGEVDQAFIKSLEPDAPEEVEEETPFLYGRPTSETPPGTEVMIPRQTPPPAEERTVPAGAAATLTDLRQLVARIKETPRGVPVVADAPEPTEEVQVTTKICVSCEGPLQMVRDKLVCPDKFCGEYGKVQRGK